MNTSDNPPETAQTLPQSQTSTATPTTKPQSPTLHRTLRWGARFTSLPVMAMLLMGLVPSMMSFSLSTAEDKIVTSALLFVGLGFIVAWKWPTLGGFASLLGVAAILIETRAPLLADPFTVAFAVQSLLFLISGILASLPAGNQTGSGGGVGGLKVAVAGVLILAIGAGVFLIVHGPEPVPIPKGKEAFVGLWEDGTGFELEITSEGKARVTREKAARVQECNAPVLPGESKEFSVVFRTDDVIELNNGALGSAKAYHIDRRPFAKRNEVRMVLNGSDPYVKTNALTLIKKQVPTSSGEVPKTP